MRGRNREWRDAGGREGCRIIDGGRRATLRNDRSPVRNVRQSRDRRGIQRISSRWNVDPDAWLDVDAGGLALR